jgi:hypothetical protein
VDCFKKEKKEREAIGIFKNYIADTKDWYFTDQIILKTDPDEYMNDIELGEEI